MLSGSQFPYAYRYYLDKEIKFSARFFLMLSTLFDYTKLSNPDA